MSVTGAGAPSVWVIVLQWNGWALTRDCLESLARRTYPGATVVVVDNGSTDGSAAALRGGAGEGVRVIENGRNLLFAEGNNVALREAVAAGADYALLLNNDTLVDPGFLEPLVGFLESNPGAGAVAPIIYYAEPRDRVWFAGGLVNFWLGLTAHRGLRRFDRGQFRGPRRCDYLTGCALLVRRTVLETVGMLDPGYTIYAEDADFSVRMTRAGHTLWCVPESKVWHRISASSGGGRTPFKVYHSAVSNWKLFSRHARPWHWLTWPACAAGLHLARAAASLLRGRPALAGAAMRGLWDGLRGARATA
ncbi:MAG: glycosyltransferase family 2 protein [Candidatus Eisenbacteria bacterium]|nr:glycosyltransferase family 2 protein [Candidatus Eisenbacteria bacterium]